MTIEIHTPEIEQRVRQGIQSGRFQDIDELLTRALDVLDERYGDSAAFEARARTLQEVVAQMLEARKSNPLPEGVTIRDLLDEGRV